jgi:hypothetical protein
MDFAFQSPKVVPLGYSDYLSLFLNLFLSICHLFFQKVTTFMKRINRYILKF